jgi:hypothetical protein
MDKLCNEVGKAMRDTAAQEVLQFAQRVADMADSTASRTLGKLAPVMMSERPSVAGETTKAHREYPPLFDELRSRLNSIENSIHLIESAMSRTEL